MEGPAIHIPYDVFCCILTNHQILSPIDLTAIALSCRRFCDWTTKYMTDSAALTRGYPGRKSLIATFTCYCCRVGWNVRSWCMCFMKCIVCKRSLPSKLVCEDGQYCGFPCETSCYMCSNSINKENAEDFEFTNGLLQCRRHPYAHAYNSHEWTTHKEVHTRIANGLIRSYIGTIPWKIIAEHDPDHRILKNAQSPSRRDLTHSAATKN